MYTISDLYDLDHTLAKDYLSGFTYPWEALKGIKDLILSLGPKLGDDYQEISEHGEINGAANKKYEVQGFDSGATETIDPAEGLEEMGKVYRDPETGKYYVIEDD